MRHHFPSNELGGLHARSGTAAFTLLEVLIAVVIMAVVAAVLLQAHIRALQAEMKSRSLEEMRRVVQRTVAEAYLGESPTVLTNQDRWQVVTEVTTLQDPTNSLSAQRFQIEDRSLPGVRTEFYVLQRAGISLSATNVNH